MSELIRKRTIRPSTRLESSKSYKIDTKNVSRDDNLEVIIDHESKSFYESYKFNGADIARKNSISFRVKEYGTSIDISWSGATPIGVNKPSNITPNKKPLSKKISTQITTDPKATNNKASFDPISNSETAILILGTMPGDKSLLLGEYYGNSRNRFWKIISMITSNELPHNYFDKNRLLLKAKIGIWDVVRKADRTGSLDSEIRKEEPNDLDGFIKQHQHLKIIAFNGTKSESIHDKYFERKDRIKYISLPSTSPANTRINTQEICNIWQQKLGF